MNDLPVTRNEEAASKRARAECNARIVAGRCCFERNDERAQRGPRTVNICDEIRLRPVCATDEGDGQCDDCCVRSRAETWIDQGVHRSTPARIVGSFMPQP